MAALCCTPEVAGVTSIRNNSANGAHTPQQRDRQNMKQTR